MSQRSEGSYTFIITMNTRGKFRARVWEDYDVEFGAYAVPRIIHSIHDVSLEEAESWVDERARFLGKTSYTIVKELE